MKTISIFFILHLIYMTLEAQCLVDAEAELAKYCHGTYLIHQELNDNVRDANLLLYKGNVYTLYLLNPTHNKTEYTLENDFEKQGEFMQVKNKKTNFQKFVIVANADMAHRITLNMNKPNGCILIAVYMEDSLPEKQAGIYGSFESFRLNKPDKGYITSFTEENDMVSPGKTQQKSYYYSINDKAERSSYKKIYAFCDGADIYLNLSSIDKSFLSDRFAKAELIGPYYYLKATRLVMISYSTLPVVTQLLIDNQTGKVVTLTESAFKRIIGDDRKLLQKFQTENHKTDKMRAYLKNYYERKRT